MDTENKCTNTTEEMIVLFDEYIKKLEELKVEQRAVVEEYITKLTEKKKALLLQQASNQ